MHSAISRYLGYPLNSFVTYRSFSQWKRVLADIQLRHSLERASLAKQQLHQLTKLRKLLKHAYLNVPWYTELFNSSAVNPEAFSSLEDLRKIPVLSKTDIQDNFHLLKAKNADSFSSFRNSTGGSTGFPLNFLHGNKFLSDSNANVWISDGAAGRHLGAPTAYLWASPRDNLRLNKWKRRFWNLALNRLYLDAYQMSETRMKQYISTLNKYKPKILIGYAESLAAFAEFSITNGFSLDFPLTGIVSSAGMLYPEMRQRIENAFKAPVFDRYGCREVGLIAYECEEHNGYHLNVFNQIVEFEPYDPEENLFSIIVTNLSNYSMPFIRYRIGDLAIPMPSTHSCPCGRSTPMFSSLFGRETDIIKTSSGNNVYGAYIRHILFGITGIRQFQFTQNTLTSFTLKLIVTSSFDKSYIPKVESSILDIVGKDSEIVLDFVDDIPVSSSGKHKFVISKVTTQ